MPIVSHFCKWNVVLARRACARVALRLSHITARASETNTKLPLFSLPPECGKYRLDFRQSFLSGFSASILKEPLDLDPLSTVPKDFCSNKELT